MKVFRIILLFVFCFQVCLLKGDLNEKKILLKQARRLVSQRLYERADEVYQQLLEDYPGDQEVIEKSVNNLIRLSELERAEEILALNQKYLVRIEYIELSAAVKLADNKPDKAWKLARDYLKENPGKINDHKTLASVFTRYRSYEKAVEILETARETAQDDYLFAREMAYNYEYIKNNESAIKEYFKYLENNERYFNYIVSRMRSILEDDPEQIEVMERISSESDNPLIREVYGLSLAELGYFEKAFEVYETLENSKLIEFAERQFSAGNLDIALQAYEAFLEGISRIDEKADVQIEIARIYLELEDYDKAERLLTEIYENEDLRKKKYRYKTDANRLCRELLADISLKRDRDNAGFLALLEEAKSYAFNKKVKQEIEYRIIRHQIMAGNYDIAQERLSDQLSGEEYGTDIFKTGYYYSYLIALMKEDPSADSLLGEIIISLPEHDFVNDLLDLTVYGLELNEEQKKELFRAYRIRQLYRDIEAVDILMDIYEETENDNILLLAGKWAWESSSADQLDAVYSTAFQDSIYQDYAQLMRTRFTPADSLRTDKALEFLKNNPDSEFAPYFRYMLRN